MLKQLALLLVLVMMGGCGFVGTGNFDANQMLKYYYEQQRTYKPVEISGVQGLQLTGTNLTFTVNAPLELMSVTKNTGVVEKVIDGATRLGQGYLIGEGVKTLSSTRDPVIVKVPE